jgi:transcriptional regulator with XRE-family HTH domain
MPKQTEAEKARQRAFLKHLGSRIREARGDMSLRALEDLSGVTASTITRIENGVHNPSIDKLNHIAAALGVTVDQITSTEPLPPDANVRSLAALVGTALPGEKEKLGSILDRLRRLEELTADAESKILEAGPAARHGDSAPNRRGGGDRRRRKSG